MAAAASTGRLPPPAGYDPVSFDGSSTEADIPQRANISTNRASNSLRNFEGADRILWKESAGAKLISQSGQKERVRRSRSGTAQPRSRGGGGTTPTLPPLDHSAAGSISISQQYDRFVDLRTVETSDTQALKHLDLKHWLTSYKQEQSSYSSVSIYAEMKLQEAMRMDAEHSPSAFRTAVCADLFFKVSELFGRYRGLMHSIGHELCGSIYADYPTTRTAAARLADAGAAEEEDALEHSTLTPFFTATRQAQARVSRLETEVSELSDTTKFYLREARTRECAVTVAQRPLSRLLLRIYFQVILNART